MKGKVILTVAVLALVFSMAFVSNFHSEAFARDGDQEWCNKCVRSGDCSKCQGEGSRACNVCDGSGEGSNGDRCQKCDGEGRRYCQKCGGDGLCVKCRGKTYIEVDRD